MGFLPLCILEPFTLSIAAAVKINYSQNLSMVIEQSEFNDKCEEVLASKMKIEVVKRVL